VRSVNLFGDTNLEFFHECEKMVHVKLVFDGFSTSIVCVDKFNYL
jgi:hypothetical protein